VLQNPAEYTQTVNYFSYNIYWTRDVARIFTVGGLSPGAAPRFWRWGVQFRSRTIFFDPSTFSIPGGTGNRTLQSSLFQLWHICLSAANEITKQWTVWLL